MYSCREERNRIAVITKRKSSQLLKASNHCPLCIFFGNDFYYYHYYYYYYEPAAGDEGADDELSKEEVEEQGGQVARGQPNLQSSTVVGKSSTGATSLSSS